MPSRRIALTVTGPRSSPTSRMLRSTAVAPGRQHHRVELLARPLAVVGAFGQARDVAPAEHAAQDRVALVPDLLGRLEHLRRRHLQEQQQVRREREAGLERARDHLGRARRLQCIELRVVLGAHEHAARRRAGVARSRTMRSAVSGASNVITTTDACSRPSVRSTSGCTASP